MVFSGFGGGGGSDLRIGRVGRGGGGGTGGRGCGQQHSVAAPMIGWSRARLRMQIVINLQKIVSSEESKNEVQSRPVFPIGQIGPSLGPRA